MFSSQPTPADPSMNLSCKWSKPDCLKKFSSAEVPFCLFLIKTLILAGLLMIHILHSGTVQPSVRLSRRPQAQWKPKLKLLLGGQSTRPPLLFACFFLNVLVSGPYRVATTKPQNEIVSQPSILFFKKKKNKK
jgi:hypothetical protein